MEVAVIPCLYDNYTYLIINGNEAAVVDPSEAWPVMKLLDDRKPRRLDVFLHFFRDLRPQRLPR